MKIRLLLISLSIVLIAAPGLRAVETPPPVTHQHGDDDDTELGEKMDTLNKAYKKLRKQIPDQTQNGESLKLVAAIRASAEEALKLAPAKTDDLPAGERAKFVADYRAKMKSFLGELAQLEAALKANNNEEAAKIFTEMGKMQKEAHKEFRRAKK